MSCPTYVSNVTLHDRISYIYRILECTMLSCNPFQCVHVYAVLSCDVSNSTHSWTVRPDLGLGHRTSKEIFLHFGSAPARSSDSDFAVCVFGLRIASLTCSSISESRSSHALQRLETSGPAPHGSRFSTTRTVRVCAFAVRRHRRAAAERMEGTGVTCRAALTTRTARTITAPGVGLLGRRGGC